MKYCNCSTHEGLNPLPFDSFGKNKRMNDGYDYWCRTCRSNYHRTKTYPQHRGRCLERVSKWQQKNCDRVNETSRKYRRRNSEKRKQTTKKWRDKNKQLTCHLANKRRTTKGLSIPVWANLKNIQQLYQSCPQGSHVHHIIPLQERSDVCGLHCEANLVILTETDHRRLHTDKQLLETSWYVDDIKYLLENN